jgi:hypothetical protein
MKRKPFLSQAEVYRLPQPASPSPSLQAFTLCPPALWQGWPPEQWQIQQWIYRRALEEAQSVVRPSLPERDLVGVWN